MLDAHIHLSDTAFAQDRPAVIARAAEAGVDRFLCCGTSQADWGEVEKLAAAENRVFPAFGVHPWFVAERTEDWKDELVDILKRRRAAVGEIGLDGAMRDPPKDGQAVFVEQLELAARFGTAVCVHCVRAWEPLLETLRPFAGRVPIMVHGFGGSVEVLRRLEADGCFISFGCAVLDPTQKRVRAAAQEVRLDRILVETDSPYMPPGKAFRPAWMTVNSDGKARNEPAMAAAVLETIAELRRIPLDVAAQAVEENSRRFFQAFFPEE